MRAKKCFFLEETKKATANFGRNHTKKKSNANQEEHMRKETRVRVGRYHEYTLLDVSLADLYKEVGQVERFPKLKALNTRANTNKSLFCEYHNGFRHRTEDWYDLCDV